MTRTDAELIAAYAAHQRVRGFSERTVARREWSLGKWLAFLDGRPLAEVDVDDVELFLAHWRAPSSRYGVRSDLLMFYRWTVRRGHLTRNPVELTDPPRLPKRAASPIAPDEVRRAINTAEASGDTALTTMLRLGFLAGLRVSEIAGICTEDVRADGFLVVRQGKGSKDRVVPLAPELAADLEQYTQPGRIFGRHQPGNANRRSSGRGMHPGEFVTGNLVSQVVRTFFKRIGIRARAHDMRHSFGTEVAKAAGGDILTTARLMGHSSTTTTQRYVDWTPTGSEFVVGLFTDRTAS